MTLHSFDALARALVFPGERRNYKITKEHKPQGVSGAYRLAREGAFGYVAFPSRVRQAPQPQPHAVAYACAFWGNSYKH